MSSALSHSVIRKLVALCLAVLFLTGTGLLVFWPAYGATNMTARTLQIDNSVQSAATTYHLTFTLSSSLTVGSLQLQFCSNTPLPSFSCTVPAGLDVSAATLVQNSGFTDMSVLSKTTNSLILTRPASAVTAPFTVSFNLVNVVNPNSDGPYYLRLGVYSSTDASGSTVAFGGMVFDITQTVNVTAVVPPYLLFCQAAAINGYDCGSATGNYINFGNLTDNNSSSGQSQLLVATNAGNGYNITVNGTTLTSGNNVIPAIASSDISRPGTSQFGINLRANSDPAVGADVSGPGQGQPQAPYATPDYFAFHTGDIVAAASGPEDFRKYTVSYLVNIAKGQPAGVYVSTLSYVASGNF